MHDVDRTQGLFEYREEPEVFDEYGDTQEFVQEFPYAMEFGGDFQGEAPFDEATEMDLAAELLSVADEAELDQFLGKLFNTVGRNIGKVVKSPIGRALAGPLRSLAKKALPIAGGALGGFFGGPVGASLGSSLASKAGGLFGLELEGLSTEDREYEIAKRVVRVAGTAARQAAGAPSGASPAAVAQQAFNAALQQHAPGLTRTGSRVAGQKSCRTGRWIRRGNKIILYGA